MYITCKMPGYTTILNENCCNNMESLATAPSATTVVVLVTLAAPTTAPEAYKGMY